MKKEKTESAQLRILFADDEPQLQELMRAELPRMGHAVTVCPDGMTAVAALEKDNFDCVLVDLDMPGLNGIEVIAKTKEIAPLTECIILTGKGTTDSAIAALRYGAFDYLQKPCKLIDLKALFQRVAEKRELTRRCHALQSQLHRAEGDMKMVGSHERMDSVRDLIQRIAPSQSTVLVLGETGTGKELAARAIHDQSHRAEKPFVAVNCGALPENLIESELFGHRKGAFTGADENRVGLFEVADGGTLFLDEIGELPKSLQAKLLRVLESGEIRRVGDNQPFSVDVRIVCATHRDLPTMVANTEFREDLMYRINTFEIELPSLRERISDIPELARHLLAKNRPEALTIETPIDEEALNALMDYQWPGNVRELANVIEHASILCDELPIRSRDLPRQFGKREVAMSQKLETGGLSLREIEIIAIDSAMDRHSGNKTAVAEELGISLKTLYNKLNQAMDKKVA